MHALLDNDEEWFNIPPIIRSVLRQLSKDQGLTLAGVDELRHDARDLRETTSHWIQLVRLQETDARQKFAKLEAEGARYTSEAAERAVSLGRQVSELAAQTSDHSDKLHLLDRQLRQVKTDLTASFDAQLQLAREDGEKRARAATLNASAHADHLNETLTAKLDSLSGQVKELGQRLASDLASHGQEVQQLHTRALRAANGVKDTLAGDLLSLSNRISDVQASIRVAEADLGPMKEAMSLLHDETFRSLPSWTQALDARLSSAEKGHREAIQELQKNVDALDARSQVALNERTEHLVKRILTQQRDTDSALEALTSAMRQTSIQHESSLQEVNVSVAAVREFLFPSTTATATTPTGGNAASSCSTLLSVMEQTARTVAAAATTESRDAIETLARDSAEQLATVSLQLRHDVDVLKEQLLRTIEGVRGDVDRVRCAAAADATQTHSSIVHAEREVASVRDLVKTAMNTATTLESQLVALDKAQAEGRVSVEALVARERDACNERVEKRWAEVEAHHNLRWNETERHVTDTCKLLTAVERRVGVVEQESAERGAAFVERQRQLGDELNGTKEVAAETRELLATLTLRNDALETKVEQVRSEYMRELDRVEGKHVSTQRGTSEAVEAAISDTLELRRQLATLTQQLQLVEENAVNRVLRLSGSGSGSVLVSSAALDERLRSVVASQEALQRSVSVLEADVSALVTHKSTQHQIDTSTNSRHLSSSALKSAPVSNVGRGEHYFSPMSQREQPNMDWTAYSEQLQHQIGAVNVRIRDVEVALAELRTASVPPQRGTGTIMQEGHAAASSSLVYNSTAMTTTTAFFGSDVDRSSSPPPINTSYSRSEVDKRFETLWDSVIGLVSRKEDHAAVEARLFALQEHVLQEALRQAEDLVHDLRVVVEQKIGMAELRAAIGGDLPRSIS